MAPSGTIGKSKIGKRKALKNHQVSERMPRENRNKNAPCRKARSHSLNPTGPWQWERTWKLLQKVNLMNAEQTTLGTSPQLIIVLKTDSSSRQVSSR